MDYGYKIVKRYISLWTRRKNPYYIEFYRLMHFHNNVSYCYYHYVRDWRVEICVYRFVLDDWNNMKSRRRLGKLNLIVYEDGRKLYHRFKDKNFEKKILECDDWMIGRHPLVEY